MSNNTFLRKIITCLLAALLTANLPLDFALASDAHGIIAQPKKPIPPKKKKWGKAKGKTNLGAKAKGKVPAKKKPRPAPPKVGTVKKRPPAPPKNPPRKNPPKVRTIKRRTPTPRRNVRAKTIKRRTPAPRRNVKARTIKRRTPAPRRNVKARTIKRRTPAPRRKSRTKKIAKRTPPKIRTIYTRPSDPNKKKRLKELIDKARRVEAKKKIKPKKEMNPVPNSQPAPKVPQPKRPKPAPLPQKPQPMPIPREPSPSPQGPSPSPAPVPAPLPAPGGPNPTPAPTPEEPSPTPSPEEPAPTPSEEPRPTPSEEPSPAPEEEPNEEPETPETEEPETEEPAPTNASCGESLAPAPDSRPAKTRMVKVLTGTKTSSGKFGVGGTDLGIAVRQPDGKVAYIFGDTFEQDEVGSANWRSPVLLRSAPGLSKGITFNGAAGGKKAKQLMNYSHANGHTRIPSDAITIGKRMYLHFVDATPLEKVNWTGIAYSDDNGENWKVSNARWGAGDNGSLQQLWTWERGCDGYVYIFSTKFISRDRPVILHRVPENKLLDKSAYQSWGNKGGKWAWGNPATPVIKGKFGEMSLRRIQNKWVLAWFNAHAYAISIKVFDDITSNLEQAKTFNPIHGNSLPQLYGGYIHPDSTLHNLHLIVSQWRSPRKAPYRVLHFITGVE